MPKKKTTLKRKEVLKKQDLKAAAVVDRNSARRRMALQILAGLCASGVSPSTEDLVSNACDLADALYDELAERAK